ncbi:MAG: hypothetical protein AAGD25_36490 [Cyanobacteria bacterium P01_F01_bin.150]
MNPHRSDSIAKGDRWQAVRIFLPIILALVIATWVNLPLFHDGAAYLYQLMRTNALTVMHQRFSAFLVQVPILLSRRLLAASHLDDAMPLMRFLFCLGYSFIPLMCLLMCWSVVQEETKRLLIWPWLIIVFVNLVNFSWVSEILMALQLSCPLTLGILNVPLNPSTKRTSSWMWIVLISLSIIIFWLHSLVILIFATVTLGMLCLGFCPLPAASTPSASASSSSASLPEIKRGSYRLFYRQMALLFGSVTLMRIGWAIATLNSYEKGFLAPHQRNQYLFFSSTADRVLLISSVAIGGLCLVANYLNHRPQWVSRLYRCGMGLAIAAAAMWIVQFEHNLFQLKTGLSIGASLVLLLLMCLDALPYPSKDPAPPPSPSKARETVLRQRLMMTLSLIFLTVMLTKSIMWHRALHHLRIVMVTSPTECVERYGRDFDWLYQGSYQMLNHWSLPILALLQSDRSMPKVVITENCQGYGTWHDVDLYPWGKIPKDQLQPQL